MLLPPVPAAIALAESINTRETEECTNLPQVLEEIERLFQRHGASMTVAVCLRRLPLHRHSLLAFLLSRPLAFLSR